MALVLPVIIGVLAIWNIAYCTLKIAADFRAERRLWAVAGLLAVIGVLAPIAVAIVVNRNGS